MSSTKSSAISNSAVKEKIILERTRSERASLEEGVEQDVIVRLPPKRCYSVELEIESIKKAEPKLAEPEIS